MSTTVEGSVSLFLSWLFASILTVWTVLSLLRFVRMNDLASRFQRWRRYDRFGMVPVGAFFAPEPPPVQYWLLVRDVLVSGEETGWTVVPRFAARRPWHALWNPDKHASKLRSALAKRLLGAVRRLGAAGEGPLPASVVLSSEYISVLRFVRDLPRLCAARATQFAVLETDVLTHQLSRCVLSQLHQL